MAQQPEHWWAVSGPAAGGVRTWPPTDPGGPCVRTTRPRQQDAQAAAPLRPAAPAPAPAPAPPAAAPAAAPAPAPVGRRVQREPPRRSARGTSQRQPSPRARQQQQQQQPQPRRRVSPRVAPASAPSSRGPSPAPATRTHPAQPPNLCDLAPLALATAHPAPRRRRNSAGSGGVARAAERQRGGRRLAPLQPAGAPARRSASAGAAGRAALPLPLWPGLRRNPPAAGPAPRVVAAAASPRRQDTADLEEPCSVTVRQGTPAFQSPGTSTPPCGSRAQCALRDVVPPPASPPPAAAAAAPSPAPRLANGATRPAACPAAALASPGLVTLTPLETVESVCCPGSASSTFNTHTGATGECNLYAERTPQGEDSDDLLLMQRGAKAHGAEEGQCVRLSASLIRQHECNWDHDTVQPGEVGQIVAGEDGRWVSNVAGRVRFRVVGPRGDAAWYDADDLQISTGNSPSAPQRRRARVGDRVVSRYGQAVDDHSGPGSWRLAPGEIATVVEVDRDGDFLLENPAGETSEFWKYASHFRRVNGGLFTHCHGSP
eukprot:TRINITY_DN11685_c2_g1_i1.p1 TRINITY_DN11685_c2_g1~~TRINITY_DN11685_c2_g1_i1.p1  ORF type:complete len:545 (+),score=84.56 TRINITY_DN11685_c2_g1_i1:88-1722(+)